MNDTTQAYIGTVFRAILMMMPFVSSKLGADDITSIATFLAAGVALVWGLYQKYKADQDKHTTVAIAVNAAVASPESAPQIIADAKAGKF